MNLNSSLIPRFCGAACLAGLLSFLGLSGCSTVPDDHAIEVGVVNLAFREATLLETTAVFSVRIQNENPEPLEIEGGVHKIYLDGSYIGKGMSNQAMTVDRLSTGIQEATVYLRNLKLAGRIRSVMNARSVDYRIESVLHLAGQGRVRVSNEGRLSPTGQAVAPSLLME
jgi:LEA14-like dessication related protein